MIRIFMAEAISGKLVWEVTASQYSFDVNNKQIMFRMNPYASTVILTCEEVSIEESSKGNIYIHAYMTEEEIRKFETRI